MSESNSDMLDEHRSAGATTGEASFEVGKGFGQPPRAGLKLSTHALSTETHSDDLVDPAAKPLAADAATATAGDDTTPKPAGDAAVATQQETPLPAADGSGVGTHPLVKTGTDQLGAPAGEVGAGGKRRARKAVDLTTCEREHLEHFVGDFPITTLGAVGVFLSLAGDLATSDIPAAIVAAALSQGYTEADLILWSKTPPPPPTRDVKAQPAGNTRLRTRLQSQTPAPPPAVPQSPVVILDDDHDDDEEEERAPAASGSPLALVESQVPPPPSSPAPVLSPGPRFHAAAQRITAAARSADAAKPTAGGMAAAPTAASLPMAPQAVMPSSGAMMLSEEDETAFMRGASLAERVTYAKGQGDARLSSVLREEVSAAPCDLRLHECGGGGKCLYLCLARAEGEPSDATERDRALLGLSFKVPALMLLLSSLDVQDRSPTVADVEGWMRRQATPNEYAEAPALMGWALLSRRCVKVAVAVAAGGRFRWQCYGAARDPPIYLRLDNHHYTLWDDVAVVVDEEETPSAPLEEIPAAPMKVLQPARVAGIHLPAAQKTPVPFVPARLQGTADHVAGGSPGAPSMSGDQFATRLQQLEQAHAEEMRGLNLRVNQLEATLRGLSPPRAAALPVPGSRAWPHGGPTSPLVGPGPTAGAPSAAALPPPAGSRGGRGIAGPAGPSPAMRPVERTCWTCGLVGHIARWCPQSNGGFAPRGPPGMGAPSALVAPPPPTVTPRVAEPARRQEVAFAEGEHRQRHHNHHRPSASRASVSSASVSDASSSGAGSGSGSAFRRSRAPHSHRSRPAGGVHRGRVAANRDRRRGTRGASPVQAPRHAPSSSRSRSPADRASRELEYFTNLLIPRQQEERSRGARRAASPTIDRELLGRLLLGKRL
jgi:hypothetical protein